VHLVDGSVVVFRDACSLTDNMISGAGLKYDLTRKKSRVVKTVPMDSVAAIEYYDAKVETGPFLVSAPAVTFTAARLPEPC